MRTSSVWRRTPVLEKMERKCARAVLRRMFRASAASSRDRPLVNSMASAVSALVRLNSCLVTASLARDLLAASRMYTSAAGWPFSSAQSRDGIDSTTTPRLTSPEGRVTDMASAPFGASGAKAPRIKRCSSRLSLGYVASRRPPTIFRPSERARISWATALTCNTLPLSSSTRVATDKRLMAWEYSSLSDSLRSRRLCNCKARRRCGRNIAHSVRSCGEKLGERLGRVMRKRTLPPSGVEMSAPIT